VVHFEPCYEHCDRQTLLGLMRQRYFEVNDYNTNLSTLLHEAENQALVRILEEKPAIVGSNPFLVASLYMNQTWKSRLARINKIPSNTHGTPILRLPNPS
jgi:hypothetical protein